MLKPNRNWGWRAELRTRLKWRPWGNGGLTPEISVCQFAILTLDMRAKRRVKYLIFFFIYSSFLSFFFFSFFFVSRGSLDPIASSIKTCQRTTPSVLWFYISWCVGSVVDEWRWELASVVRLAESLHRSQRHWLHTQGFINIPGVLCSGELASKPQLLWFLWNRLSPPPVTLPVMATLISRFEQARPRLYAEVTCYYMCNGLPIRQYYSIRLQTTARSTRLDRQSEQTIDGRRTHTGTSLDRKLWQCTNYDLSFSRSLRNARGDRRPGRWRGREDEI